VTDAQQAATYGYHLARPQNAPPAREPALSPAAAAVADGNGTDDYAGLRVPDGGCVADAKRLLSAGAPSVPNEYLAQKLAMESFAQSKADSRVLAKLREWSACMKTAEYTYATPMDANDDGNVPWLSAAGVERDRRGAVRLVRIIGGAGHPCVSSLSGRLDRIRSSLDWACSGEIVPVRAWSWFRRAWFSMASSLITVA
jgi:hypothetical protein